MASWVKYGKYFISAGIAVGGVLWFNRPNEKWIMGEDPADVFEDAMEKKVVACLEGHDEPDFIGANGGLSNSISSLIKYGDIAYIAGTVRETLLNDAPSRYFMTNNQAYMAGDMFWTTNSITGDTFEPSEMLGTYQTAATTNASVITYSYSYTTNTCVDAMVTTATRSFTPVYGTAFSKVPYITFYGDYSDNWTDITPTNLPISPLVFSGYPVTGIKGVTSYVWWPFEEPYRFPWEQWNWPEHSRVTVSRDASGGLTFTNAICWISTNALAIYFGSTGAPGYVVGRFADVSGNTSVKFAALRLPTAYGELGLDGPTQIDTGYIHNIPYSPGEPQLDFVIYSIEANQTPIEWVQVYGEPLTLKGNGGIGTQNYDPVRGATVRRYAVSVVEFEVTTNNLAIIRASIPARTNIAPIFFCVNLYGGAMIRTNDYFGVSSIVMTNNATGTATAAAVASTFTLRDDKRITTNKLYELREVLTNLYRTVYFRGVGALVASNKITTSYTQYGGTLLSTNITGSTLPIGYYAIGDGSSYIPALIAGATANTVTTNSNADVADVFSEELTYLARNAGYWDYGYPEWEADAYIAGEYSKVEYEYKGVTLEYPSLYAVTNGLVKSVKVYAVYDITALSCPAYASGVAVTNNLVIDGAYWNLSNLGIEIDGNPVNVPSDTPPETRVLSVDRSYSGNNKAVYRKIYEVDDPTTEIRFDVAKPAVTPPVYSNKPSYVYYKTFWNANDFSEWFGWEYDLAYTVAFTRFMIVVDWNFKHLGNGFTPSNNVPGWRQ